MVGQGICVPTRQAQHIACQFDVSETAKTSEEAAGAEDPSQRPCDTGLAGTWESEALSPVVTELHEDVAWLPRTGQFW